ncbi:dihydroorotate dehydrogenase A (fumarate) [Hyphodiscus hymeniophilus]|uniref:Dihydroorotate dehydrogenase (fumarate) n=1 Tax=Hyphodiscus hymeniophilus TaxID=353542 RepID=A0A9P6VHW6_9HELO|nr:dihydroorotate dehydrogenase A (fumarate) [Hyphodiscus hymeniophilus]
MSTPEATSTTPGSRYLISINPPLLNSSNPWATTYDDLKTLYDSPHTGAVTIRTSLWSEFKQDPKLHQYTFFSSSTGHSTSRIDTSVAHGRSDVLPGETSSLNTLGYSPISFPDYMKVLKNMSESGQLDKQPAKPFIVSVTGTVYEVAACCTHLLELQNHPERFRWKPGGDYGDLVMMMEINLSCPNILDKPPPAYDGSELGEYITAISEAKQMAGIGNGVPLHVGIKTPPYTYADQFKTLIQVLERSTELYGGCPISFITATNTLGSCLVLDGDGKSALGSASGSGIGGMAGEALHPLALGNVKTIREMLDASPFKELKRIAIVGIGGVSDAGGYSRMRNVGAMAVGVGTALGREGVEVFGKISSGLSEEDLKCQ